MRAWQKEEILTLYSSSLCARMMLFNQFFSAALRERKSTQYILNITMTASIHATSLVKYFYLFHHSGKSACLNCIFSLFAERFIFERCFLPTHTLQQQREIPAFLTAAHIEPSKSV